MSTREVVCSGFKDLKAAIGIDGDVSTFQNGYQALTLHPASKTDFWRKTYYEPLLVKDDAIFLYYTLQMNDQHYTMETHFTLTAASQFDQAGLMVRLDAEHWIKAGIEVVDSIPRLSCVVTNGYSDWSTQPWKAGAVPTSTIHPHSIKVSECRMRIHCRSTSFVVETWINEKWEFIRIAHLSVDSNTRPDPLEHAVEPRRGLEPACGQYFAGIFAACPQEQLMCTAHFTHFEIRKGSQFDHKAE